MIEKKINVMRDNIRILNTVEKVSENSLKIENEEIRLSSKSKWKSNFLINYVLFSNEFFSEIMTELDYKNKIIANLEIELDAVKDGTEQGLKKHHRGIIRKLKAEFNKLPVKNRIYKKMILDWLSVNLR